MGKRIQKARKDKGLRQTDVAEKLSVSKGAVSQWELDLNEPSTSNLAGLARLLDASFEWLATGRGIQNINDHIVQLLDEYDQEARSLFLDDEQFAFLKNYLELPEDQQENLAKITAGLITNIGEK